MATTPDDKAEPIRGDQAGTRRPDDDQASAARSVDVEKELLGGSTYRGISEQALSPAEERFERRRRTTGLWLAPLVTAIFYFLPLNLEYAQQTLAAVLLGVVVLWMTEPVPIPIGGLIGIAAIALLGAVPAEEAFVPFGDTTVLTFIGAFILAQAMLQHGLARRFAFRILAIPGVGRSTTKVILAFGGITCLLSAFVSNTATVAMLLPTALGILTVIAKLLQEQGYTDSEGRFDPTRLRVGVALMLMLAYGASVGGLLTPVGSPPNLIGRDLIEQRTGESITFAAWVGMALPLCALMFLALSIVLIFLNRPEIRHLTGVEEYVARERASLGPLSRAELNTLFAFGVTVALWITPGIVGLIAGADSALYTEIGDERLDEGIVAVIGAGLLFLLPTDWKKREYTMTWTDAAKIDWGTIVLFGTGIVFGSLLESTGLAETIGTNAFDALGFGSTLAITAFAVVLAIMVSETTSNTASAAVVVPIILPLAEAAGVNPLTPALAATFAASFGFMLPVSTPQNAIVYGSGAVPITKMIRSGISFDLLGGLLVILLLPVMIGVVGLS